MEVSKLEEKSIQIITNYLEKNPGDAAKGAETLEKQITNIKNCYSKSILPNEQTTNPDYLVSELLEYFYPYPKGDRKTYQKQYNRQKQIEMMIGEYLERYIIFVGKEHDWVYTAKCIRAVDFLKKDGQDWLPFQIKNSDNTENSSAKKIRDGTLIRKWFRRFSSPKVITPKIKKNGELSKAGFNKYPEEFKKRSKANDTSPFRTPDFNWEAFPDDNIKKIVSEKGFRNFIFDYLQGKTIFGGDLN